MLFQQGDVLIETVSSIPSTAKKAQRDGRGRLILAEGEVTGHAHAISSSTATLFEVGDSSEKYLSTTSDTVVEHEEHGNITLPKGDYKISIVQEYDHFAEEAREVRD